MGSEQSPIRGEGTSDYLTARDGWIYQKVIGFIRSGSAWAPIAGDL